MVLVTGISAPKPKIKTPALSEHPSQLTSKIPTANQSENGDPGTTPDINLDCKLSNINPTEPDGSLGVFQSLTPEQQKLHLLQ